MLDALIEFIFSVFFYEIGRHFFRLVTFGKYDPNKSNGNVFLVSLVGFAVSVILVAALWWIFLD